MTISYDSALLRRSAENASRHAEIELSWQAGIAPMSFKRGRLVIATPVGGLPEQVRHGETGLLTDDVSATALAASIRRFAEDRELLRRCAENALRHADEHLGWKALAPRFSAVLEQIARRSAAKARS
jgi:glycosyltransferase involved in cell wall biosynthesis